MVWEYPTVLLGLWILPLVAVLLVYAHRKRQRAASRFVDPVMARRLMPSMTTARPWLKGLILLAALTMWIVALARPRFGVYFEEVAQRGVDLFVLLDVSRSMTAHDVVPSRLDRAKSDLRDLVSRLAGDRIGLIAFAGRPTIKVPLTTDYGFFQMAVDEIDSDSAPRGGSLIGDAIRKGIEAMPERQGRDQAFVLITDGEDHQSYPLDAAQQAAERGIKIFAVGLGDARDGARVPAPQGGEKRYLTYQGDVVWSKLDESLLTDMAMATGGAYIPAGTRAYDLGQIYEDHLNKLTQGEIRIEQRKRHRERFQWFAGLGLLMFMVEMLIPGYPRAGILRHGREEVA